MKKFRAVLSVDTSFTTPLDGVYSIGKYALLPCQHTEKNRFSKCSNFIIQFDFDALENKDIGKKDLVSFLNLKKGTYEAQVFIAWLVCASRHWARLSTNAIGPSTKFEPTFIGSVNTFDESILDRMFHINKKSRKGTFVKIPRRNFVDQPTETLWHFWEFKLPLDFPDLTTKLFSLESNAREKFLNACFSYQLALELWTSHPTLSIVALVSAVESIMVDEPISQFCNYAKRKCDLKKGVMKKFRRFFEHNLFYPLPKDLKTFLEDVYSGRCTYVHKALLGEARLRGPHFGISLFDDERKLDNEKRHLEQLVNAALIEWLQKF